MELRQDHDTSVSGGSGPQWDIQLIPRLNAPPLRVSGRRIFHHEKQFGRLSLSVTLWQKKSGGYVLAHSAAPFVQGKCHAESIPTVAQAMDALEHYCENLRAAKPVSVSTEDFIDDMLDAVVAIHMEKSRLDAFFTLCGEALADWDMRLADLPDIQNT